MADLKCIVSFEALIAAIAGKHESAAVKSDLALAGTAVSLLAQTLVPRLDITLDLASVDAGLAKAFEGISDTITAIETPVTTEAQTVAS